MGVYIRYFYYIYILFMLSFVPQQNPTTKKTHTHPTNQTLHFFCYLKFIKFVSCFFSKLTKTTNKIPACFHVVLLRPPDDRAETSTGLIADLSPSRRFSACKASLVEDFFKIGWKHHLSSFFQVTRTDQPDGGHFFLPLKTLQKR